jgi:hypothetical protein
VKEQLSLIGAANRVLDGRMVDADGNEIDDARADCLSPRLAKLVEANLDKFLLVIDSDSMRRILDEHNSKAVAEREAAAIEFKQAASVLQFVAWWASRLVAVTSIDQAKQIGQEMFDKITGADTPSEPPRPPLR